MFKVIVPTLNAAKDWPLFVRALCSNVSPHQVLIVDSESTDGTSELARSAGFSVVTFPRSEFNHGGTRQRAAEMFPEAEILVYLTQDAVLEGPNAVSTLLAAFEDPLVGAAYGRQLPRPGAGPIEAHVRLFNYPDSSDLRDLSSRARLGIKTIFISNSFAAYRRSALLEVRGFPVNVIFGEDTITAANLLLAKYKVSYVANACVYHSHSYSWKQDFGRSFDIGVLHSRERWLMEKFGGATGEGKRFVLSELVYVYRRAPSQLPSAAIRTMLKVLGYRLGLSEAHIPQRIKPLLSMHPGFWKSAH